eukprot:10779090-Alexandrium_andersonii.AAC.1
MQQQMYKAQHAAAGSFLHCLSWQPHPPEPPNQHLRRAVSPGGMALEAVLGGSAGAVALERRRAGDA